MTSLLNFPANPTSGVTTHSAGGVEFICTDSGTLNGNDAVWEIQAGNAAGTGGIAEYSDQSLYSNDDIVWEGTQIYRNTTAVTVAETFDVSKWTELSPAPEGFNAMDARDALAISDAGNVLTYTDNTDAVNTFTPTGTYTDSAAQSAVGISDTGGVLSYTDGTGAGQTFTPLVTNIAQGTRTATAVPITSSTGSDATLSIATTALAGTMSSADKVRLDAIADSANNYTHPAHNGDDIAVANTALTGATVFSDVDITVTTDAEGHVTAASGSTATRDLSLGDIGFTGDSDATDDQTKAEIDALGLAYSSLAGLPTIPTNNNQLTNGAGYVTSGGATPASHSEFTANGTLTMTGFKGFIAIIAGAGGSPAGNPFQSGQSGKGGSGGLAFMSRAGTSGTISITVGNGGGASGGNSGGSGGQSSSVTFNGTVTAGGGGGGTQGSSSTPPRDGNPGTSGSGNAGVGAGSAGGQITFNGGGGQFEGGAGETGRVTIVRFS